MEELKSIIEKAWDDRSLLGSEEARNAVFQIIELLDKGLSLIHISHISY